MEDILKAMKSYIPTMTSDMHEIAVFLAKHNAILRAAIIAVDPEAAGAYDAAYAAIIALDALRAVLNPIQP